MNEQPKHEKTIGQFFKAMREKRSLGTKEVAERLHIHQKLVAAFEAEDLSVFSAHVYARGFFEKYAALLQLNKQELTPYFEELWIAQHPYEVKIIPEKPSVLKTTGTRLFHLSPRGMAGFGLIAAFLVIGFSVWYFALSPLQGISINWQQPSDKTLITDYIITAKGSADTRLELTLNKQPVYIGKDGTFETKVFLQKGINELVLEAKNGLGRTKTMERRVVIE